MQFIRQLAPKDFSLLPQEIDQDFLERIQKMAHDIDEGAECIILSEDLR
jgi:predicted metallo-beta-lactamase superfamily hydrolase